MSKQLKKTVESILESRGFSAEKGSEAYNKASAVLESYLQKVDEAVGALVESDYTTLDHNTVMNMIMKADYDFTKKVTNFDKTAESAASTGKSNTVGKGKAAAKMDGSNDLNKVKDDKTKDKSKDWSDKIPAGDNKGSVDKKAATALKAGKSNTVGKGVVGSVANKGMLESLVEEVTLHDTYIDFVRSFDNGDAERSQFLESVVSKFMESHKTIEKLETIKSLMEADESDVSVLVDDENDEAQPVTSEELNQEAEEAMTVAGKTEELANTVELAEDQVEDLKELQGEED